ncbi:MAG: glutathione S-transferase N-terminal domain-containing protein [Gammaproteobacteria bacterium]|nr:glutathione S-transferase N-terminal domain-containing protein [Gammaproteobacteria bacterium]
MLVRGVVGPLILLWEALSAPKKMQRSQEAQRKVDLETSTLAMYQFQTCPFCMKVRREMRALALNIELRDAQRDPTHRAALLQGGGAVKVPCLKIVDEKSGTQWLYESADIIRYLKTRFS